MAYPPQRPMFGGMARGMAQQGAQGAAPQQGSQPGSVPTVQRPMPQNPWMQQAGAPGGWGGQNVMALRGLAQGLQGQRPQNWGDPGDDAPVIQNPGAGRMGPGGPMQAAALQQAAQRFAGMQKPGMIAEDDPRMRGAVR